ncbi:MAG: hypothetical protein R3B07_30640 [Polyangiaceae bacterium]
MAGKSTQRPRQAQAARKKRNNYNANYMQQPSGHRIGHALYDHIWRGDILLQAWKRVRQNQGAAGVDRQSICDVEEYGLSDS